MENDDRQECDGNAWNDEVDSMEQRLTSDGDVERNIWIRFRTARVELLVLTSRNGQKIPFNATVEVLEVNAVFDYVIVIESG